MANSNRNAVIEAFSAEARLWSTSVGSEPAFLLARANAVSLQRTKAVLQPLNLDARTYTVLCLAAEGTRPSQRELSEFLKLDPSQIVALIDRLETEDLARREPDPSDRRAKVVVATDRGKRLAETARNALANSEHEWLGSLSEVERDSLSAVLAVLARETST